MAKPSQIIILVEDKHHQQLIFRYLRYLGLEIHAMRFAAPSSGAGSGEQWVREQFAAEVKAYRRRHSHTQTKLIVVIDADSFSVQERLAHLDHRLEQAGVRLINLEIEQIARLIPKRNIETWVLSLNSVDVDEERDYKGTHSDWTQLIRSGAVTLYEWTRPNAQVPPGCIPSLQVGVRELKRLDFQAS